MKRILIISDGKPGHLNQSIAFCNIKNISYDILEVNFKSKAQKLLSYAYDKIDYYTDSIFDDYKKYYFDFYDAIVSTGSNTYYFNKFIANKYNKKSIVLMFPKSYKYTTFDYIIAQEHDKTPILKNIIKTPLNISFSKAKGYIKKDENSKSLAVVIGGDNKVFSMNTEKIKDKLDFIFSEFPEYKKYVTTSRRTTPEIEELVESYNFDYKLIYSKEPNINPIGDFIDVCDVIFITIDSTSMISEARANSEAKINIIDLHSKKDNTKFHKLANIVNKIDKKVDFTELLKEVKI